MKAETVDFVLITRRNEFTWIMPKSGKINSLNRLVVRPEKLTTSKRNVKKIAK
jgi:hypothetical protein